MISLFFWSSLLLLSLVGMLLLCRKQFVVYSWPSEYSKATREYFYTFNEAKERANELRNYGYFVLISEV